MIRRSSRDFTPIERKFTLNALFIMRIATGWGMSITDALFVCALEDAVTGARWPCGMRLY